MNKARLIFNKILKAKFYIGLFFIGILFIVGGFIVKGVTARETESASATITHITSEYDAATERYEYTVTLVYEDKDGVSHTVTSNSYSTGWKEGKVVTIKYDPSDPESISIGNSSMLPYIFMAAGLVAIVISAVKFIIIIKTSPDEDNEFDKVDMKKATPEELEKLSSTDEPVNSYYFYYTQGFKTSYIMETNPGREKVMEALNQHLSFFTHYQFKFVNHLTGKEEMKTCTHTVTTSYGENNIGMDTSSSFKMDGVKCWNVLGKAGYSIEPYLTGLHAQFDVYKYGVKIATFEQAGTNAATGKNYKAGNIAAPGIYTVSCRKSDIEGVFLACFIVARTYDAR